jgi:hypothetical protein
LASLDGWRRMQDNPPTRPEAIRLLMQIALQQHGSTPVFAALTPRNGANQYNSTANGLAVA